MDNIMNTAMGTQSWISFLTVGVLLLLVVLTLVSFYKNVFKPNQKSFVKPLIWLIFTITVSYGLFVAYGSGDVGEIQSGSSPEGSMEMLDTIEEVSMDSITKSTDEKRPESLKRQDDDGFEKEKKEADEYLKSVLKEYEK